MHWFSLCFLRIRALRRLSCSTWSVRSTSPQTAVLWTCPRTSCAATWSTWSSTSPASTGKIVAHHHHHHHHHTGRILQSSSHLSQYTPTYQRTGPVDHIISLSCEKINFGTFSVLLDVQGSISVNYLVDSIGWKHTHTNMSINVF